MSELIDNGRERVATLKHVIRGLQRGVPLPMVQQDMVALVRQCDAADVAVMEQELIAEGTPVTEIMGACDLHAHAVREVLVERESAALPAGHPVDVFRRENAALGEQVARVREALAALASGPAAESPARDARLAARRELGLLMDVDKHYQRKEQLLFPFLEQRGITGPSQVMWAKDDEVRDRLRALDEALGDEGCSAGDWARLRQEVGERALSAVAEMVFKEEHILLPMSLQKLREEEWAQIAAQSAAFGFCLVDPAARWTGADAAQAKPAAAGEALAFATGSLTPAQLQALFRSLPVDVTFVDADDRVRYFSDGGGRVFQRPLAVLGRKVQNCHPPASVGTVERILADFKSGAQNVAEFWLQMRGRFVHIRYFALRDEAGTYLGTLEVTQDLTRERTLEGDRRLLQYES